ncbi:MAG: hypothetical protein Q9210_001730 [Variospora velana]
MRLINTSKLTLHDFYDEQIPPYAILSHTWGTEEVTFQDFEKPHPQDPGRYVWIDTCCIDKTSSAELSEAINSMFRWYRNAEVCYAYMVDVDKANPQAFGESRWFRRGWTLQELLAPEAVLFYDRTWEEQVCRVTGVSSKYLSDPMLASVAAKMSWAAHRKTTRVEDIAYCLMGLFDVNMPLLYGEGQKAFLRLQEVILRQTSDESIFAWKDHKLRVSGLFARSPEAFATSGDIVPRVYPQLYRRPSVVTNRGLEIDIHSNTFSTGRNYPVNSVGSQTMIGDELASKAILLNCAREGSQQDPFFIPLSRRTEESYVRFSPGALSTWSLNQLKTDQCPYSTMREYIEMDYIFFSHEYQRQRLPSLLIMMTPPNHDLLLIGEGEYAFGCRIWLSPTLDPHEKLGAYVIKRDRMRMWLLFKNNQDEFFVIEMDRSGKHPNFKVFTPRESSILPVPISKARHLDDEMKSQFAATVGTDRASAYLQADSALSISLKKKLVDDELLYVLEIKTDSIPDTSEE